MNKKSIGLKIGLAAVFSICLAILMYSVAYISSDDSVAFWRIYKDVALYGKSVYEICAPLNNINSLLNFLAMSLCSFGEFAIGFKFAGYSLICYFFSLLLVQNTDSNKKSCVAAAVLFFILLPTNYSNIYHLHSTAITLFFLLCLERNMKNRKRSEYIISTVLLVAIGYFFREDILLIGATIIIPLVISLLLYIWEDNRTKKYFFALLGVGSVCVLGARIVLFLFGRWGNITTLNKVYGGSGYTSWASLSQVLTSGISFLGDAITASWNLPDGDEMLALSSVYYIVRYLLFFMAVGMLIKKTYEIVVHGIKKISFIDSLMTISIWTVLLINIINQTTLNAYEEWGYCRPHNRYLAVVWFLLPILLCRELPQMFMGEKIDAVIFKIKKINIDISTAIIVSALCLSCVQIADYPNGRRHMGFDLWAEAAEWLNEHNYTNGVAFEPTNRYNVDVWTGGKIHTASAINYVNDRDQAFDEKYRQMNFVLVRTAWEEYFSQVEASDYDYKHEIINHEKNHVEAYIYCYDHDVRYDTEYIDADDREYYEYIVGLGKTRFTVQGEAIDSDCLSFFDDEGNEINTLMFMDDGKCSYEMDSNFSRNIRIYNPNRYAIEVDRVWAARKLATEISDISGGESMNITEPLEKGNYFITVCGKNLLGIESSNNAGSVKVNIVSQGTERIRYEVIVEREKQELNLVLHNVEHKDAVIENLFIEEQ